MGIHDYKSQSQKQAAEIDQHIQALTRIRNELDPSYAPYSGPPDKPHRFLDWLSYDKNEALRNPFWYWADKFVYALIDGVFALLTGLFIYACIIAHGS